MNRPSASRPISRLLTSGSGVRSWPLASLLAVCLVGTPLMTASGSFAADLPYPAPPIPSFVAFSWSGLYAGVQAGYDWDYDHLVELTTATGLPTGSVNDYHPDGFSGGGHVGINYQLGSIVVGAVADIEGSTLRGTFHDATGLGRGSDTVDWQGSARGKLGYAFDTLLLYATGGYTFANLKNTYVFIPTNTVESFSSVRGGWTVGGGLDYAMTDHWIVSAEYRYSEYGRFSNISTVAFPGLTGRQDFSTNNVRLGVSYKF